MVVKTAGSKVAVKAEEQGTAAVEPQMFKLELARIKRYHYGQLYVANTIYEFDGQGAQHMLSLEDPQGLPVFMVAKKRTKMVQVEVDMPLVRPQRMDRIVSDLETFSRNRGDLSGLMPQNLPVPKATIDLSDEDPEIAAKLKNADAGLTDSAAGVTI